MTPPLTRLFILLASKSDSALILRRGPSKQVATLGWNRKKDTFELGQWLKGTINPDLCDLSPDGRHFLYCASKFHVSTEYQVAYTVMSRAPYLKALRYWAPQVGMHGGAFFNDTQFWLTTWTGAPEAFALPHFKHVEDTPELKEVTSTRPNISTYRRKRDGWTWKPDDEPRRQLWYKWRGEWALVWSIERDWRHPDSYELRHYQEGIVASGQWQWADFDPPRNRLCFARDGGLWSLALKQGAEPIMLHDFNDMRFEPRVAPY